MIVKTGSSCVHVCGGAILISEKTCSGGVSPFPKQLILDCLRVEKVSLVLE